MIIKYTLRLIKSTLNRFIAILAIVFIGVSFMMGLRSNYTIMQDSMETFIDNKKLYDIQIYSNFGFDENDINEIRKLDYIDEVYASKTRDVYSSIDSINSTVVRLLELDSNLNRIELEEGRMPERDNECAIISNFGMTTDLVLGGTIEVNLKNEEITDSLKNTKYTIVGVVKSVEYTAKTLSTSNLDNKDLLTVLYIPNSNFISDYYTCLYISLKNAKPLYSFDDEYINFVDEKAEKIEKFSKTQSHVLKDKILADAYKQIEEGKAELEENRNKYQAELDEGKAKLDDAYLQLQDAKREIEEGEAKIPSSEKELADGQAQVDAGYAEIKAKEQELNNAVAQIEGLGMSINELQSLANSLYSRYAEAKSQRDALVAEKDQLDLQRSSDLEIVANSEYSNAVQVRRAIGSINPKTEPELYAKLQAEYQAYISLESYDRKAVTINTRIAAYDVTLGTVDSSMRAVIGMDFEEGYAYITDAISQIESGKRQIKDGYAQLEAAQKKINDGKIELENGKKKLADGKVQYQQGLIDYEKGLAEYNDGVEEFNHQMQEAEDQIEDAENQLANLQEVNWIVLKRYNTCYSYYMYVNTCEQMKSIGTIIPLLFFIVAALVCSTTMTRLIDEQRSQIGIYRALGFQRKEIISIYLLYVVFASLAASIVAVFVGVVTFPTIIYTTWRMMYDLPPIQLSVPIIDLIICVFSFTILMMAVSYIVINGSLKECAAQLLRPKAPKNTKQILLEKWHFLWNKLPFTSKVTARNIFRYKGRFIMTVIGVAGCTSLLLMGFGIKDSVGSLINLQFKHIVNYDYNVQLKNDRHIDEILTDIYKDENNEDVCAYQSYQSGGDIGDFTSSITVNVLDAEMQKDFYTFEDAKNGKLVTLDNKGVIVTEKYAKINNLKEGDKIEIQSYSGAKANVTISHIIKNYLFHYLYMSEDLYISIFNEPLEYTSIAVKNSKDTSKLIALQDKYNDVNSVSNFDGSIQQFNDMIGALNLIIIIIILVAGALAFVVLINLTNVNISERIREIATLKVLGFREGEVNSYIFKEVLLMSVVGAIIGLPLGSIEEKYIMNVIDVEICMFPHVIKPISFVYAFVITIVFTVIVLLLTRKTLRNVEMVESLKSIE